MGFSPVRTFWIAVFTLFLLPSPNHGNERVLDIGVILNFGSFVGKGARTAMEIALEDSDAMSRGYKLKLHFKNSGGKPLQAVSSAENLIKSKNVRAIIGLETWKVAELVSELGNQFQVPVISLARRPFGQPTKPGLLLMGSDESEQMRCIAKVVQSFNRKRVSVIYEEDSYDDKYSSSLYLSKELHYIGSEIEDRMVLSPFSSLLNPEAVVTEKLRALERKASPVFIVLDLSVPVASSLLNEAKQLGLFKGDAVWILSETALNVLGSVNSNVTSSMRSSAIGIVTDLPRKNKQYSDFDHKFRRKLSHKVGDLFVPGVHALQAYDSIALLTRAVNGVSSAEITSEFLMKTILKIRFDGLSGEIKFKDGRIANPGKLELVSITGGKRLYKELKMWSSPVLSNTDAIYKLRELNGNWQHQGGDGKYPVNDVRCSGSMKIGVPLPTPFDMFVNKKMNDSGNDAYSGFCINVFNEILSILKTHSSLPTFCNYTFYARTGEKYDDLVDDVHNQTYQAAVGDITILSNRSKNVDFTQPFIESGMSMIVLADRDDKTWIFVKPFTPKMWMASGGILILTMLTVWCMEHSENPEFQGALSEQLATALWFTFSSLFFAHREKIHRNLTRAVLVVWFFMALILTQSYTASLTSMLTVQNLKPNEITIEWLKLHNERVGCDNSTFMCNYLKTVHNFSVGALVNISNYSDIYEQLKNEKIKAMFVENPYERAFFSRYCSGFSSAPQSDRFGGFGFAFQKGSPWTANFSEAILELSENGKLKQLGDKWFSQKCIAENVTASSLDSDTQSLGLGGFWALYVFCAGISTLCLLLFYFFPGKKDGHDRAENMPMNGYPQHEVLNREMDELQRR